MRGYELQIKKMFEDWAGETAQSMVQLVQAGSDRRYFRLSSDTKTAIAAQNADLKENIAFLKFTEHFNSLGLNVPQVYAHRLEQGLYLQEDLGDTQLFNLLPTKGEVWAEGLKDLYKKSVEALAHLQIRGGKELDYSVCYPHAAFDEQSMTWDLNYFKHYFLKLAKIPFDEAALERDFKRFINYLLLAERDFFLFRDFQSRNIMVKDGKPYFIDYQGGRRGALQYDVASLLYQAKGSVPHEVKNEVLTHYLDTVESMMPINRTFFCELYYGYVLIRCLQALGAYGFRGLYERRDHFLTSIPFAIRQIEELLRVIQLPIKLPELWKCLHLLVQSEQFAGFDKKKYANSPLKVAIKSFSYKKTGYPTDPTDNGGGFVFDCRFLHNPGRYDEYKKLSGLDQPVITFLKQQPDTDAFLQNVYAIVDKAVEKYLERNFENLAINFGCTGGQHRSVFSAESLAKHLREKYGINVSLQHIEKHRWEHLAVATNS
jgi:aminoglycoside/choline kinase family phosphotransferase